jgi:hypothetical protein
VRPDDGNHRHEDKAGEHDADRLVELVLNDLAKDAAA